MVVVMVGTVDVAMVAEAVALVVAEVVVSGDEDGEAMVPSQLGTMTMVNMMHHLPHVVSMQLQFLYFAVLFVFAWCLF